MKKMLRRGLFFCVIFTFAMGFVWFQERQFIETRKERVATMNFVAATQLEDKINREIYITSIMKSLLQINEEETLKSFNELARDLIGNNPGMKCIQLAPKGKIEYIYPLEGNEAGKIDLFATEDLRGDAVKARDSGKLLLTGPIELRQGGRGLVARNPVFDKNGEFWGFSIVIIKLAGIFDEMTPIHDIAAGYYCTIVVKNAPNKMTIFSNIDGKQDLEMVKTELRLAGDTVWEMSLVPKEGWITSERKYVNAFAALMASLLLYKLMFRIRQIRRQMLKNKKMAMHDPLTNALNQRALNQVLAEYDKSLQPYGLVFVDLDYFKEINDAYGHDIGDRVLVESVNRMKAAVREVDKVYRVGGDEFVILITGGLSVVAYTELRERLKLYVEKAVEVNQDKIHVRISVGYAACPADGNCSSILLKRADQRMYEEKQKNHSRRAEEKK